MLRAGDDRVRAIVKVLLDALADSRDVGDWEAVQHNAIQLLGWVADGSRGRQRRVMVRQHDAKLRRRSTDASIRA